jgi:hypothetical protein
MTIPMWVWLFIVSGGAFLVLWLDREIKITDGLSIPRAGKTRPIFWIVGVSFAILTARVLLPEVFGKGSGVGGIAGVGGQSATPTAIPLSSPTVVVGNTSVPLGTTAPTATGALATGTGIPTTLPVVLPVAAVQTSMPTVPPTLVPSNVPTSFPPEPERLANPLRNASFEDSKDKTWDKHNLLPLTFSADSHEGQQSIELRSAQTDGDLHGLIHQRVSGLPPGSIVAVHIWAKGTVNGTTRLQIRGHNGENYGNQQCGGYAKPSSTNWTEYILNYEVDVSGVLIVIIDIHDGLEPILVDDVYFTRSPLTSGDGYKC